jgi:hypothetical protein
MPKRTINTRSKKASTTTTAPTETLGELLAAPTDTASARIALDASDPVTTDTATVALNIDSVPLNDIAPVIVSTDTAPDAPVAPIAATPAVPDAKAAFLERKANATLSAISQYAGASLAVHRSDKQPADATYLARVASPVQKIGPNGPTVRDNSFILAVYDYLTTYFGGNYAVGFNPANFGADLGTTSRAASVGYLALTDDASDIVLTPTGIERGALLTRKRAEAAAKAAK